jgi:hypothetical protein
MSPASNTPCFSASRVLLKTSSHFFSSSGVRVVTVIFFFRLSNAVASAFRIRSVRPLAATAPVSLMIFR